MQRGDTFFMRGKYRQALEQYRAAQRKDPALIGIEDKIRDAEVRVFLQRGDEAVQRSQWDVAERCYAEVRRLDPTNSEVDERITQMKEKKANEYFRRGQQLLGRGNPFDAISEFEQALIFQPDHPRASEALDRALKEKDERETDAESAFQDGLRATSLDEHEEAIQHFTRSTNLNPHHPSARGELADAKKRYAEALVFEGDNAMSRKQWAKAVENYRRAQSLDPRLSGLKQRIRKAQREARAGKLIDEGNRAFERGDWRVAFESFSQAREFTENQEPFIARYRTAREKLAAQMYTDAQMAERDSRFSEALSQYKAISKFYPRYRDVEERYERLDVALRTAERAYSAGVVAQEERNLVDAREQFRICADVVPGYRDLDSRSETVNQGLRKSESLYRRAVKSQARGDVERARVLLEECLSICTPFRDATARLSQIGDSMIERAGLSERYEKACRAQAELDFQLARKLFLACQEKDPAYQDVEARLQDVDLALREAEDFHERAGQAETQGNLRRARTLYEECLAISSPYKDAEERLKKVRLAQQRIAQARKLEEERRLVEALEIYQVVADQYRAHSGTRGSVDRLSSTVKQLEIGYESMLAAEGKGKFKVALSYASEIRKKCVGYKDVDRRAAKYEAHVHYTEGCAFQEQGEWDKAVRSFERCVKAAPNFRDVSSRLRSCKKKLEGAGAN